jgi:hypothetical protein
MNFAVSAGIGRFAGANEVVQTLIARPGQLRGLLHDAIEEIARVLVDADIRPHDPSQAFAVNVDVDQMAMLRLTVKTR